MRLIRLKILEVIVVVFCMYGYFAGCTHDDELLISQGPDITRGDLKLSLSNTNTAFDKTHSNVGWQSLYLGSTAFLTGRFDDFGFNLFDFDESNAAGIRFEGWVWLNSVNTSEPGRDDGCLLGTFGTNNSNTTETENVAYIRSKAVELSTTDKGYNVTADLVFHGVTKEVVCKLDYDGKSQASGKDVYGFNLEFQFLAKTDFLITSNNIADNVDVKCNAIFRVTP